MTPLLVALGGGAGAGLRCWISFRLDAEGNHRGTLAVNLVGSFLLGLFLALGLGADTWALAGVGFCGGLTTYSTFAVQTSGLPGAAAARYVVLTLLGTLAAAALGFWLAS